MEQVIQSDCLDFLANYKGKKFNLVYLDPPYFLERKFSLEASSQGTSFQGNWNDHELDDFAMRIVGATEKEGLVKFLSQLHRRLILMKECMANDASIFLHIGTREGPFVSQLLDQVFGFNNWRSTITWQRSHPHNNLTKSIGNVSDFIYYYSVSDNYTFNVLHTPHDETYLSNSFSNEDEHGPYALAPIIQERSRKGHFYEFEGFTPPYGWRVRRESLENLHALGKIHWGNNRPYKKVHLHEAKGAALQNIWTDIYNITRTEVDSRKYPTQKPVKLLKRIIELSTNPGDLVYDPFCGSGTTLVAGKELNREVIGTDISPDAVQVTNQRLKSAISPKTDFLFE